MLHSHKQTKIDKKWRVIKNGSKGEIISQHVTQRDASPALMAVKTGHGDSDPGQNDARISPRVCLPEVTSDLKDVNQHLRHITFTRKSTPGADSLRERQYL